MIAAINAAEAETLCRPQLVGLFNRQQITLSIQKKEGTRSPMYDMVNECLLIEIVIQLRCLHQQDGHHGDRNQHESVLRVHVQG